MSRIATRSESTATNPLEEIAVDLPDGRTARVESTGLPTNRARVDVRIPNGRHWIFGVNGDVAGLVMVLNQKITAPHPAPLAELQLKHMKRRLFQR